MPSPEEIKRVRVELGLSQSEFSNLIGVSWPTVSQWERGKAAPTPHQAGFIEKYAEVSIDSEIGKNVKKLLVTDGVVMAVFFLLSAVFSQKRKGSKR